VNMRGRLTVCVVLAGLSLTACGRRATEPTPDDLLREKELDRFLSAIRTVQERYVDVSQVQLDQLISNSLKGMVETIDPHATVLLENTRERAQTADGNTPAAEILGEEDGDFLVLRIYRFDSSLRKTLRQLENTYRRKPPARVLLDGRGADGEDYLSAVAVAEWFLKKGSLVGTSVERQGQSRSKLITRRHPVWPDGRVVMLIDRQTSGPAEVLAAALKHHQRATLVGEPSRGVAVIRSPVHLNQDWTIQLSTGRILDPADLDITGNAQAPDIVATTQPDDNENVDWVYRQGVDTLKE